MARQSKPQLCVSEKQRTVLLETMNSRTARHDHRIRASIIFYWTEEKMAAHAIASLLKVDGRTVARWKRRWFEYASPLAEYDANLSGVEYERAVLNTLNDAAGRGCPGKFTAEQICQIINVSCESPDECGVPISHWSLPELAKEVVHRGIVESISKSRLHVFLKSSRDQATQNNRVDPHSD